MDQEEPGTCYVTQLIHHTAKLLGQGDGLRLGAGVQQESQECIRRARGMLLNEAEEVRVS